VEDGGRTVSYAYDGLKRLVQEQITESGGSTTIGYILDRVGNRLQKNVVTTSTQTTTYSYNADDELLTENGPDGLISYFYNGNGETTQKMAAGVETVTYSWDFEGRMVGALTPFGSLAFGYDLDGVRVSKSVNGSVTRFVVDKNREYAQVLEERDGSAALQVAYIYGDDLLTQERSTGISFYHTDGQLSTRQLTDVSASVSDRYTFDAFGIETSTAGTTENLYRYGSQQADSALGLYYLRARYYSQSIGRFGSLDSYQGDDEDPATFHKYLYSRGDPTNYGDPSGLDGDLISTLQAISIQISNFVKYTVPLRAAAAFGAGGTAIGRFFNMFGKVVQDFGREIIRLFPDITVLEQEALPGLTRIPDFLLRLRNLTVLLEGKYQLPRAGEALARFGSQLQQFTQWASQMPGREVVVWALKQPDNIAKAEQVVLNAAQVQGVRFVYGAEGLFEFLLEFTLK